MIIFILSISPVRQYLFHRILLFNIFFQTKNSIDIKQYICRKTLNDILILNLH